MNKKLLIGLSFVAVLVLVSVAYLLFGGSPLLSVSGTGQNHYQAENFLQGLFAGTRGQLQVKNDGTVKITTTGVNGQGLFVGSTTQNYDLVQIVFATSTFATTTLGSQLVATGTIVQQVSFPFPNLGTDDVCMASVSSAPSSTPIAVESYISQASATRATSTVMIENGTSTAVTIGAGFITVLCIDPAF